MTHTKDEALKLLDALRAKYSDVIYDVSPHLAAQFENGIAGIEQALAAPAQEPVAQDAKQWGSRLNDASWAATKAWNSDLMGPMTGKIFNNIKGLIRTAILSYLDGYTAAPAAQPAPVREPEHIVHSNGRYSPLLTRMMNKRVESNVRQVIHLYDEPPAAQLAYKDSTPNLHVGDSAFESWFSEYHITNDMIKPKQVARDAYAAGMGDPLVAPAAPTAQEPVSDTEIAAWAERHDIQGTPTDLRSMFEDAASFTNPPAAQPAPVQEPVGHYAGSHKVRLYCDVPKGARLYTTPPAAPVQPVNKEQA